MRNKARKNLMTNFRNVLNLQKEGTKLSEILVLTTFPHREYGTAIYWQDLIFALSNVFEKLFTIKIAALETENKKYAYQEGNYVLMVVWSNFISSILYLFAAYGFIKFKTMTFELLSTSIIILIIGFMGLYTHIFAGGLYETKTIGAMLFIITITLAFTVFAYLKFKKFKK
jgi:ABC-type glycerol-3-phosphate transport system permease component